METCIAIVINAVLGGVITSLVTNPPSLVHATYWQAAGQLVMPTLGPASMLVPGITSLTRGRVAKGVAPFVKIAALQWIPANLVVRTVVIAVTALLVLGSAGGFFLWQFLALAPPTLTRMVAFMVGYGVAFGLLVTPVVVLTALGDGEAAKSLFGRR